MGRVAAAIRIRRGLGRWGMAVRLRGDGIGRSERGEALGGRGRDGPFGPPPTQICTCSITAYGSYLGCLVCRTTGLRAVLWANRKDFLTAERREVSAVGDEGSASCSLASVRSTRLGHSSASQVGPFCSPITIDTQTEKAHQTRRVP